jgi:hypothetical protein
MAEVGIPPDLQGHANGGRPPSLIWHAASNAAAVIMVSRSGSRWGADSRRHRLGKLSIGCVGLFVEADQWPLRVLLSPPSLHCCPSARFRELRPNNIVFIDSNHVDRSGSEGARSGVGGGVGVQACL